MGAVKNAILTALESPQALTPAQRAFIGIYLPGCPACEARRDREMTRDRDVERGLVEVEPFQPSPADAAWWAAESNR